MSDLPPLDLALLGEGMYLGRREDGAPFQLDPSRLRTHGVVVGMTGSGKTGLCVVMLEELAAAGVPVIAIDPKGDLGNLALMFPDARAQDFAPWTSSAAEAEKLSAVWRDGRAHAGLQPELVAALRERLALTLYTPGSEAGTGVDLLGAFRRPTGVAASDPDVRRALVAGTVSGLLGLAGRDADPVRDPAHIVLSTILDAAWSAGEDPDLETLVLRLVDPPFEKVGVFPLDRFFPPDDRMKLAMALNGVLASPTFAAWTRGVALDMDELLGTGDRPAHSDGRTPVHVFSLAHLGDAERAFFLSLLLGRLQAWSRAQPGTEALRALLFFDEVAGFLPPHPKDPPTKAPLLAMMKQARAVGLGVLLATQNPVDVDYKALSNAGLWFIGRLQTRQDRDRLLKGIGTPELDERVADLGKRSFLVVDAKADAPAVFGTRFAASWLRGPFTRAEIRAAHDLGLVDAPQVPASSTPAPAPSPAVAASAAAASSPASSSPASSSPTSSSPDGLLGAPPPAPGDVAFLDPRVAFAERFGGVFADDATPLPADGRPVLRPVLWAELALRFDERNGFLLETHEHRVWTPLGDALGDPVAVPLQPDDLLAAAPAGARFQPLPTWLDEAAELRAVRERIVEAVYRDESRGQLVHAALKLYARGDEAAEAFRARVDAAIQERIDARVAKLEASYRTRAERLEGRIKSHEARIAELEGTVRARKSEEVVNVGETIFSWFSGRKKSVSTAMRHRNQTVAAEERAARARQELSDLEQEAYELDNQLAAEVAAIEKEERAARDGIEERPVQLERSDLDLRRFGILWVPATRRV
ncbi:MAG: DUF853 family protein [Alphaproteobacteria bacterium]|nr:DUF853 family protein [Alphaproteobacteria bacterium]